MSEIYCPCCNHDDWMVNWRTDKYREPFIMYCNVCALRMEQPADNTMWGAWTVTQWGIDDVEWLPHQIHMFSEEDFE